MGGAQIAGRVLDPSGASIASAQVRVLDLSGGEVSRTLSDDRGEYGFSGLPDGTYRLEFDRPGFKKLVVSNAQVRNGFSSQHDETLQIGDVSQTVTVTESVPIVETTTASLSGTNEGAGGSLGSGRGLGHAPGPGAGGGSGGGMFRSGTAQ